MMGKIMRIVKALEAIAAELKSANRVEYEYPEEPDANPDISGAMGTHYGY